MARKIGIQRRNQWYEGRPTALEVRFSGLRNGADSIEIHVDSPTRQLHAKPVPMGKPTLDRIGRSLIEGLENHWRRDTSTSLRALAELGYEAFNLLASNRGQKQQERWRKLFEAPNDVRHSLIKVFFESDLSFPIGLLCSSKPDGNDYKGLANKFLGARTVIINTLGLIGEREGERNYVSNGMPCSVAHAIDVDVPGATQESKYLQKLQGVQASRCLKTADLINAWNDLHTGIIHFSSHHRYDNASNQYVLTLSNGETFRALSDRVQLTRSEDNLPFLFMNGCNTGRIFAGAPDTFIRSLCPNHSAGVLSTLHSIGGVDAARFAKKYYENWVKTAYAIDALAQTKHTFIFNQNEFSAITYEFWEMPEVLTLFERENDELEACA